MLQLPWLAFVFILSAACVLGVFIGSWMRGLGASEVEADLKDQVQLFKTRWEDAESRRLDLMQRLG
jgi:hypothetical protein